MLTLLSIFNVFFLQKSIKSQSSWSLCTKVLEKKKELDTEQDMSLISNESQDGQSKQTFLRAAEGLNKKTARKKQESEQKVEICIRCFNAEDQYAVMLYNNGKLIVPGAGSKHCLF